MPYDENGLQQCPTYHKTAKHLVETLKLTNVRGVRNADQRTASQNKGLRFQENIADKKFFQRIITGVFLEKLMYFKLHSQFEPAGDQPEAIKKVINNFKNGSKRELILGATGTGKTFVMAHLIKALNVPTLVIAHNKTLAGQLYGEFKNFFPENPERGYKKISLIFLSRIPVSTVLSDSPDSAYSQLKDIFQDRSRSNTQDREQLNL